MKIIEKIKLFGAAAVIGLAGAATQSASAAVVETANLHDVNSDVEIVLEGEDAGTRSWEVDGVDHLFQQWFYYRVEGDDREQKINELGNLAYTVSNGDLDAGEERIHIQYSDDQRNFNIEVDFILTGGQVGSMTSDLAEIISINNTGDTELVITLIQYSDFDLNGDIEDASVQINGGNTAQQLDTFMGFTETVVTPLPTHLQADLEENLIELLENDSVDDLNDLASSASGPGDYAWAFQWDAVIAPGGSFIISKDKQLTPVPEPATMSLIGLAGLALARRRK